VADVLAVIVLLGAIGRSQYLKYFVVAPYLDERGKRDRSLIPSIAAHRDWKKYADLLEKEGDRGAARAVKIEGVVLSVVILLLVIVLLYRRVGI
jgi:hypothetical protein